MPWLASSKDGSSAVAENCLYVELGAAAVAPLPRGHRLYRAAERSHAAAWQFNEFILRCHRYSKPCRAAERQCAQEAQQAAVDKALALAQPQPSQPLLQPAAAETTDEIMAALRRKYSIEERRQTELFVDEPMELHDYLSLTNAQELDYSVAHDEQQLWQWHMSGYDRGLSVSSSRSGSSNAVSGGGN